MIGSGTPWPFCRSCVRRWVCHLDARHPSMQQVRGKKKLAQSGSTLKVRLLEDVPRFGRQGAIIAVPAGRMRNYWFPRKMAEYVTVAELKRLDLQHMTFERDFGFGVSESPEETKRKDDDDTFVNPFEVTLLSPQRSIEILSDCLPAKFEFFRPPILSTPRPRRELPQAVSSAAADLAAASEPTPTLEPVAIYGSVSTADVATIIKALLAKVPDGSRIVLTAEDISFEGVGEHPDVEGDRLKRLGEFDVKIAFKGVPQTVMRKVVVRALE